MDRHTADDILSLFRRWAGKNRSEAERTQLLVMLNWANAGNIFEAINYYYILMLIGFIDK